MKIIITGASGFIGNSIYLKLQSLSYDVVRVSRQKKDDFFYSNNYLSLPDGDVLIHLGESSNRGLVNLAGKKAYLDNQKVIRHINEKKYSKVIYGSSAAIYGDKSTNPRKEKEKIIPTDNYSKIKLFSEEMLNHSNNIILRLSNVYGIGMSKENVISDILSQINQSGPILLKNLIPIRDFIYIDDVVDAILIAIKSNQKGIFNIGSGTSISIGALAKKILNISKQPHRDIDSECKDPTLQSNISIDITHICNIMSWKPRTDLKYGLSKIFSEKQE